MRGPGRAHGYPGTVRGHAAVVGRPEGCCRPGSRGERRPRARRPRGLAEPTAGVPDPRMSLGARTAPLNTTRSRVLTQAPYSCSPRKQRRSERRPATATGCTLTYGHSAATQAESTGNVEVVTAETWARRSEGAAHLRGGFGGLMMV